MNKKLLKLLSLILSLTMVFSSAVFTNINVNADMTTEQMVANAQYNLALGKGVQVAPSMSEGNATCLTDGKFTPDGEHAATTFGKTGTYYQVDLGEVYDLSTLDELIVGYKENSDDDTPVKGYKIQVSANGLDFTDAKSVLGTHVRDACQNNNLIEETTLADAQGTAVRYMRLYYPDAYTYGIQVTEIAILDTDGNATKVEMEVCDDAAGVTVSSPDFNTVSYRVEAGENQEGYKYIVSLENAAGSKIIGNGVEAGKDYVVDYMPTGIYKVKVVACYNGAASKGIFSEDFNIEDFSNMIRMKRNIANSYTSGYPAKIVEMKSIYDGHSLDTAARAIDGIMNMGEGPDAAMRTAAGTPQYFVIDLGEYYTPSEMKEIALAYTNKSTYASDTKVEFSLDGNRYTEVGNKTGYECDRVYETACATNRVSLNSLENYMEKAVRFVKVTLSGGASNYGYVVNEVGVIANTDEPTVVGSNIPNAADVIVDTTNLEKIKYTIVAGEGQEDATYHVSFGGRTINTEAKAGVEYEYVGMEAGTYELKVCTVEDGWLSKGITKSVVVDGYINYLKTSLNLALKSKHDSVTATCDNDNTGDNYLQGSQEISAGVWALNNGTWTDFAHHTGYLQTRPDNDEANIIYDLGKEYNKTDLHSVVSMYEGNNNVATEYEIYLSATGEEGTYEKVFYVKDAKYSTFAEQTKPIYRNDKLDITEYTQETVRFVKYHIITGNYARHYNAEGEPQWGSDGYHLCELAVMGKESLLPEAPRNVSITSPEYDTVVVTWDDIDDERAVYNIYMDGNILTTVASGVNEKTFTVRAGTHTMKISAVVDGMERSAEEVRVTVETEVTTAPPTEKPTKPEVTTPKKDNPTTNSSIKPTTKQKPVIVKKPGRTKVTKVKVSKKKVLVKFKRIKGAKGYRIQYSLNANFKKAKTITTRKLKVTIKKLRSGKRYFIRIRAYKIVNGKKLYGAYSRKIRTKKIK